jgi:hypothetical protein
METFGSWKTPLIWCNIVSDNFLLRTERYNVKTYCPLLLSNPDITQMFLVCKTQAEREYHNRGFFFGWRNLLGFLFETETETVN